MNGASAFSAAGENMQSTASVKELVLLFPDNVTDVLGASMRDVGRYTMSKLRNEGGHLQLKKVIKSVLNKAGFHLIRINKANKECDIAERFSRLGEEKIIQKYLGVLAPKNRICVDIAASDGVSMSNTYFLYKEGWNGLAVECDPGKFAILSSLYKDFPDVVLLRNKITPENVNTILNGCFIDKNFAFLNLDIDSYDYFVLDRLLSEFRPLLICAEINEKVPPPIKFTVKYSPDHAYAGDHFYGQSISQLYELCKKFNYVLAELCYNNAFLMPKEVEKSPSLQPEEAYEVGYQNKEDRKKMYPWNKDMDPLLSMPAAEGVEFIKAKFAKYKDKFICSL
jgi:hypothetical protein